MKHEKGSATVETVVLVPVLVALVLFAVFAGRSTQAMSQIRHAADQGARAASLVRPSRMQHVGQQAVMDSLRNNGSPCAGVLVNVAVDTESTVHAVMVEVECEISLVGLELLELGKRTIEAESVEVVDVWRVDQ
ncbi:MAG: TadE/TadG family type IV pilus assembly protein [Ilumatobacteraceae bacterium]|jgi:Flp pilus assembly protein TadG